MEARRISLLVLGAIAVTLATGYGALVLSAAKASALPPLEDGDIVFQTSGSGQSLAIFLASGSPYTHVGLIRRTPGGIVVVEGVGPVVETPLRDWIARGKAGRLSAMRARGLSEGKRAEVLSAARAYYGRPYDPHFTFGTDRFYCSELVWQAYKDAGIDLGTIQKISELKLDSGPVRALIERRWKDYPPCKMADAFESCYRILLDQSLITPVSIARDPQLDMIYSNYGFFD